MGGKSKTRNTNKDASATMDKLSRGRVSNDKVMGMQEDMVTNQLAQMIPFFSEMMNFGTQSMGTNPIFGGYQPEMPQFNFEMPQQPQQQPQVAQTAPPGYGGHLTGGQQEMLRQRYGSPSFMGGVNKRMA
jgi:hypothetical protein